MRNLTRIAILLATMAACVGCDQVTKSAARRQLEPETTLSFFHDVLRLQHVRNSGAFLSMGDSLSQPMRTAIFTFGSGLLVGGVLLWAALARRMSAPELFGAGLVCGGGLGNLIDRSTQDGMVTDFLNVGIGPLRTGIFNLADVVLLVGVALVVTAHSRGARGTDHSP